MVMAGEKFVGGGGALNIFFETPSAPPRAGIMERIMAD
jgi:hypothetical protein